MPETSNDTATVAETKTQKRWCFDLDGTICTQQAESDYTAAAPIEKAVQFVRERKEAGDWVIINTARGSMTGNDWLELTELQLMSWGVPYDELHVGIKPYADVYVDDKAVVPEVLFNGFLASHQWHTRGGKDHKSGATPITDKPSQAEQPVTCKAFGKCRMASCAMCPTKKRVKTKRKKGKYNHNFDADQVQSAKLVAIDLSAWCERICATIEKLGDKLGKDIFDDDSKTCPTDKESENADASVARIEIR